MKRPHRRTTLAAALIGVAVLLPTAAWYVTGSREKVVLETHSTAQAKEEEGIPLIWNEAKQPRPKILLGSTHTVETPLGRAFVTVNRNEEGQPFEAFITTAKAGSETAAVSEAIGRLISYILRLASPVSPIERIRDVSAAIAEAVATVAFQQRLLKWLSHECH